MMLFCILQISAVFFASCSQAPSLAGPPSPTPAAGLASSQQIPPSEGFTPDPGEAVLAEIQRLADDYNRFVEVEIQAGRILVLPGAQGGGDGFRLPEATAAAIYQAWDDLVMQIQGLNEEYYRLYSDEYEAPYLAVVEPRPVSDAEIQELIDQSVHEYTAWLENERQTGRAVQLLFDPYELRSQTILVGESYIEQELRWKATLDYRLRLLAPPDDVRQQDFAAIQRVFQGEPQLVDAGRLMPMYTYHLLSQYNVAQWMVYVDSTNHQILLIDRSSKPAGQHEANPQASPAPRLEPPELEARAVEWIRRAAPDIVLEGLTPDHGQKGDNYFFRWEDRAAPLLPDGWSAPFVQVAITVYGELLNYYCTLFTR